MLPYTHMCVEMYACGQTLPTPPSVYLPSHWEGGHHPPERRSFCTAHGTLDIALHCALLSSTIKGHEGTQALATCNETYFFKASISCRKLCFSCTIASLGKNMYSYFFSYYAGQFNNELRWTVTHYLSLCIHKQDLSRTHSCTVKQALARTSPTEYSEGLSTDETFLYINKTKSCNDETH